MTEREFIIKAFGAIWPDALDIGQDETMERIDAFLERHHLDYHPVEFVKAKIDHGCYEDEKGIVWHPVTCNGFHCRMGVGKENRLFA